MHIRSRTVPLLLRDVAGMLRVAPEVPSRDGMTRELVGPVMLTVTKPWVRYPLLPGRQASPWVTLAEFPWLVAGRNDVAWLEPYLPRAKDFSDDGETWRAGYGPRLRDYGEIAEFAHQRVDQLEAMVRRLNANHGTRQAVMSLWDPSVDNEPDSKDYPCTNWFQALVRNGYLHLHCVMRSNDFVWGLSGVNLYNWTMLQELLCACTGTQMGRYVHTAGSLHVYERHFDRLPTMALRRPPIVPEAPAVPNTTLAEYTERCRAALALVEDARRWAPALDRRRWALEAGVGRLGDWAEFMLLHPWLGEPEAPWQLLAHTVARDDWWLALLEYLYRTGRMEYQEAADALAERSWAGTAEQEFVLNTKERVKDVQYVGP